jgi:uncharacterized protein YjbI with pentapeptide repeats
MKRKKITTPRGIDYLTAKPSRFFLLAALIWGGIMCFLNYKDGESFAWHDLLVEANGMVFDLIVFGVLLSTYEALKEKRERIERLHEEIADFRGWDEKEAMFRIVGAIKRLNHLKVSQIDLNDCFLQKAKLKGAKFTKANLENADLQAASLNTANFEEANLQYANLSEAILLGVNFKYANLSWANLQKASLWNSNLQNASLDWGKLQNANFNLANLQGSLLQWADLENASLQNTDFQGAILQGANLIGANFKEANLQNADLENAIVGEDWFEKLEAWGVLGKEEIKIKYQINEAGELKLNWHFK